jgi:hypothetical protein
MSPRMPGSVGVAVRLCCHRRPLACKSWADHVPQCARGVLPRKIFGFDVVPSAFVLGSLLHDCYILVTPFRRGGGNLAGRRIRKISCTRAQDDGNNQKTGRWDSRN